MKDQTSELIRHVEAGEQLSVTTHGRVVARIVPARATPQKVEQELALLASLDAYAQALAEEDTTGGDMSDVRRDL